MSGVPDGLFALGFGLGLGAMAGAMLILGVAEALKLLRLPASVDRSPQGGDRETGRHAKHESAVAANSSETPNSSGDRV